MKQVGATMPNENKTERGPSQGETAKSTSTRSTSRPTTSSTTSTLFIGTTKETTEEVPRPLAATFVVAMNRVDVVDLVVDLVDLDLDVDLVVVDLAGSLCDVPRSVLFSFGLVAPTRIDF